MNNSKKLLLPLAVLALITIAHAAHAQSPQILPSSAKSSPPSATRANDKPDIDTQEVVDACKATADELEAARRLIAAGEAETLAVRERLEIEKRLTRTLEELTATQRSETEALRAALVATAETVTAKTAVIAAQEKLIAELKRHKSSPWRRLGDILVGAAAIAVLR